MVGAAFPFWFQIEVAISMDSPDLPSARLRRLHAPKFSLRTLLGLIGIIALSIVTLPSLWARRTVCTTVTVATIDVQLYEPYIAAITSEYASIAELRIDQPANAIVVCAQARHIEAATKDVERLVAHPKAVLAASSLGLTWEQVRDLMAGS